MYEGLGTRLSNNLRTVRSFRETSLAKRPIVVGTVYSLGGIASGGGRGGGGLEGLEPPPPQ